MAPSESIAIDVRKKFRPKTTTFTKCLLDDLQFTLPSDAVKQKCDEGAQNFDKRAKAFSWLASVSAHRSGVSLQPGFTMDV